MPVTPAVAAVGRLAPAMGCSHEQEEIVAVKKAILMDIDSDNA
jgi:hypothetical protein